MKTYLAKAGEIQREYLLFDASEAPVGRLAVRIANALRGKDKPTYTPHVDTGAFVIVINAEKAVFTGRKSEKKIYVCNLKPDGSTLVKDRSNTFTLDGKECYYSLQQIIDYTGNNEKMYFNWKVEEYLTAGRYDVIIYADTQLIGSQPFELND